MKILITGIHGFVGNNLVAGLKGKHNIYGLDIISPLRDGVLSTYDWHDLSAIPQMDIVIHLAGMAHDTKNKTDAQAYFDINTGLTIKIFDWFLTNNSRKFIFFSSVKAVADSVPGTSLTEEDQPNPKTLYGKSKLEAERYIINQSLNDNQKVYILRPCMIHGPGNKGNLNLLFKIVQKGIPWPLGKFENVRSFTSIDNLTYIISQLIVRDIETDIYQIADDESLSTNELIRLIAAAQKRKPRIFKIPKKLIYFLAKIGDYLHLPLNSERLKKLTESYLVSNKKIKGVLELEKMPFSATEGFKKTFNSFQE